MYWTRATPRLWAGAKSFLGTLGIRSTCNSAFEQEKKEEGEGER